MISLTAEFKVSAVIPTYNAAPYIAQSVDSVLAQTFAPCEIIVVDDGSTDDTARVLAPYGEKIKYIYQKNQGEPAARNTGIRAATGDYIAFLDADDLWVPEKLELQMQYVAAHPECAMVYTDMMTFDQHGIVDPSVKVRFNITFPSGNIFRALFYETLFGSGSVVFRKSCVDTIGYFDESFLIGSDYEMWLRMARHFQIGFVDKPLLMYRQHPAMSTRGLGRKLQNGVPWEVAALQKILRLYPEARQELGDAMINQRMAKPIADLAHICFQQGDHKSARKLFRTALTYWRRPQYLAFYLASFVPPGQIDRVRRLRRRFVRPGQMARAPIENRS